MVEDTEVSKRTMAGKERIRIDPRNGGLSFWNSYIIRRVFASHDYNYIIHYVNLITSRKYRPAATQGGFKIDRMIRIVRGVMAVCMVRL